jgi:hypothetical protein
MSQTLVVYTNVQSYAVSSSITYIHIECVCAGDAAAAAAICVYDR